MVTIFLLRIRMKRTPLGPQWQFFCQKIRLNSSRLIIYTPTSTENPQLKNRMPTIMMYTVLCDCQIFKVNFVPSLISTFWRRNVPGGKNAVWFFAVCLERSSFCVLSRQSKDRHVFRTRPIPCSICRSSARTSANATLSASVSTNDSHNLDKSCLIVCIL